MLSPNVPPTSAAAELDSASVSTTLVTVAKVFGLHNRFEHLRKTSQEVIAEGCIQDPIDMLLIDGDHSYEAVKFDFELFGQQVPPGGLILLHDSINVGKEFTSWEVKQFLEAEVYGREEYETFTLPFSSGLTLVSKRK